MTVQSPPQKSRSRSSLLVLLALTGTLLLVFLASIGVVVYLVSGSGAGEVADDSFLEVRLDGEITDAPAQGGFYLDPEDIPPVLTDISGAIRAAGQDERITGLYLKLYEPAIGWAGTQELRDAIASFRAAGKPCVAFAETYSTSSYYLASACDRVVLAPAGMGFVTGLSVSQTYYAGAFEKWNVQADLLHVGDYKSAVEPFTRKEPSEPASLAMNQLLDSLWGGWVAGVAEGRGRSVEEVQSWVDHPSLSAKRMLESGMVDALAFPDQVRARAVAAADEGWVATLSEPVTEDQEEIDEHFTSLDDYLQQMEDGSVFGGSDAKIAVVYAEGPIVSGEAEGGLFGGAAIADRTVRGWLHEIREDEDIEAVVVRVNSPGGSGLASDMIWRDLQRLKESGKPIVISMGNYAASGGYYIATAGDHIVAEPSTLTGSIGVFGGKLAIGGAYEWFGLSEHTYKRGANADLLSPSTPFSEDGRLAFQAFLDDFYEVFLQRVAEARGLERDQVHEVAQGRVWTGEQALERKLVDELGGLDVALAKAAELAEVEEYAIERWPKSKTFMELVLEDLESASAPTMALPAMQDLPLVDQRVLTDLLTLEQVLGDGVAALVPGNLRIE